jgi:hypothetical protein
LRGCSEHGRIRSSGTRCTRSCRSDAGYRTTGCETGAPGAGVGWVRTRLPPNNAPRPRPKAGFAMRAECRRAGELSTRSVLEFKLQLVCKNLARRGKITGKRKFVLTLALILTFSPQEKEQLLRVSVLSAVRPANPVAGFPERWRTFLPLRQRSWGRGPGRGGA